MDTTDIPKTTEDTVNFLKAGLVDIKDTILRNKRDLAIIGVTALITSRRVNKKRDKNEDVLVAYINHTLAQSFERHRGNFVTESGTWVVPSYKFH